MQHDAYPTGGQLPSRCRQQGANLTKAQLQGVDLRNAKLQAATLHPGFTLCSNGWGFMELL